MPLKGRLAAGGAGVALALLGLAFLSDFRGAAGPLVGAPGAARASRSGDAASPAPEARSHRTRGPEARRESPAKDPAAPHVCARTLGRTLAELEGREEPPGTADQDDPEAFVTAVRALWEDLQARRDQLVWSFADEKIARGEYRVVADREPVSFSPEAAYWHLRREDGELRAVEILPYESEPLAVLELEIDDLARAVGDWLQERGRAR